jgi:hypothetical protein
MGMPIEEQAMEVVQNDSMLNIHKGRIAAWKALAEYIASGIPDIQDIYVPDISTDDQRLDDVNLQSFNSVRNAWTAMYTHWKYPDLYVTVQGSNGAIYTYVTKMVRRSSDLSQATLF